VDLRREELKLKIDEYSDQLVQSIEATQLKCTQLSKGNKLMKEPFIESNNELNKIIKEFDIFEFNDKKFEELKKKADDLRIKFNNIMADYKITLLNNKKHSFEFKEEIVSDVFGKIIECNDDSNAEATLQMVIEDFTKFKEMKQSRLSPQACLVRNHAWKIFAQFTNKDDIPSLGFFLNQKCNATRCSVNVVAELRLLHQTDPKKNSIGKYQHLFDLKDKNWGYLPLITTEKMLDPEKGFDRLINYIYS
jgi:hypothetical protein